MYHNFFAFPGKLYILWNRMSKSLQQSIYFWTYRWLFWELWCCKQKAIGTPGNQSKKPTELRRNNADYEFFIRTLAIAAVFVLVVGLWEFGGFVPIATKTSRNIFFKQEPFCKKTNGKRLDRKSLWHLERYQSSLKTLITNNQNTTSWLFWHRVPERQFILHGHARSLGS